MGAKKVKAIIFLTFLSTCLALALLSAALGSNHWIVSAVYRPANTKSHGVVNFGLFRGTRRYLRNRLSFPYLSVFAFTIVLRSWCRLNPGFGERVYEMDVVDVQYRDKQFFIRELYVTTIVCVCAAILFGLIVAALALVNTATNPIETVCHYPGTARGT